jgi:hypothetical protein
MRKSGICSIFGGTVVAAALLLAPSASAATLVGDYQFQGTRASSGAGAALTDVGVGPNSFQTSTVMGASRQVLAFPQDSGVQLHPSGLGGSANPPYSVVTTFRFQDLSSYRRILDTSNATSDDGIYDYSGALDIYTTPEGYDGSQVFTSNVYATVAITSSPPSLTKTYVNGIPNVSTSVTIPVVNDTLRFFKDNSTGEESAGAVSCIRVYSGVLTDAEIAGIGGSPTCSAPAATPSNPAPAAPVTPKKKCKKKHKKRSAESAKKKKCKKHKKR